MGTRSSRAPTTSGQTRARGAANIEGSPIFHVLSGNPGYQVEHHMAFPGGKPAQKPGPYVPPGDEQITRPLISV